MQTQQKPYINREADTPPAAAVSFPLAPFAYTRWRVSTNVHVNIMRSTRDTQYDNSQTEAHTHSHTYTLSVSSTKLARVLYGVLVSVSLIAAPSSCYCCCARAPHCNSHSCLTVVSLPLIDLRSLTLWRLAEQHEPLFAWETVTGLASIARLKFHLLISQTID